MSASPSKDTPYNMEDIAQLNKRLKVELVALEDAERHWVEETAICEKVLKRKKNMKGSNTKSKNAMKLERDLAGKLVEKTRKSVDELHLYLVSLQQEVSAPTPTSMLEFILPLHNQKSSILSEHTGSASHEDPISSVHHSASGGTQNPDNNSPSPSREHIEIIHSSALGEKMSEHSPLHHSALGRSQNPDYNSPLCSREQLESPIYNLALRMGSQSQQPDFANELSDSNTTMETLGDSQQPDFANELPDSNATMEVLGDSQQPFFVNKQPNSTARMDSS